MALIPFVPLTLDENQYNDSEVTVAEKDNMHFSA